MSPIKLLTEKGLYRSISDIPAKVCLISGLLISSLDSYDLIIKFESNIFELRKNNPFLEARLNYDLIRCKSFVADLLHEYKFKKNCESDIRVLFDNLKKISVQSREHEWEQLFLQRIIEED